MKMHIRSNTQDTDNVSDDLASIKGRLWLYADNILRKRLSLLKLIYTMKGKRNSLIGKDIELIADARKNLLRHGFTLPNKEDQDAVFSIADDLASIIDKLREIDEINS